MTPASFQRENSAALGLTGNGITMKTVLIYLLALVVFGLGIFVTLEQGRKLGVPASAATAPAPATAPGELPGVAPSASLLSNLHENLQDPLPRLFLQLIVII